MRSPHCTADSLTIASSKAATGSPFPSTEQVLQAQPRHSAATDTFTGIRWGHLLCRLCVYVYANLFIFFFIFVVFRLEFFRISGVWKKKKTGDARTSLKSLIKQVFSPRASAAAGEIQIKSGLRIRGPFSRET